MSVLKGYTAPVSSDEDVKAIQQQLNNQGANLKVDGIWGAKTNAAYYAAQNAASTAGTSSAAYPDATFNNYYNTIKSNMTVPTISYSAPDMATLQNQIAAYLRPAYDQAIAQRQTQTKQYSADIDADAASRGMGRSTWVTDAKMQQQDSEATDIANLESNYASALAQAVLDQYNTEMSRKLSADQANAELAAEYEQLAYNRAADMYNLAQSSKSSSSGGTRKKKTDDAATEQVIDWDAYIKSLNQSQKYNLIYGKDSNAVATRQLMEQQLGSTASASVKKGIKDELKQLVAAEYDKDTANQVWR